ncbi:zinc ABC transporter substrate-binding protein [Acaryochloris sp. 'Moss Beach']|uniref:metal ABC transporter solute-binding protein, Zn/Mn family n=1 Tax=Acaryochloris sp. 'Moss Beach' TaxID=2740837 RepID=UPI001F3D14D9|nr:zinc ABC transporter substrate-binding protein [Acaryochloris sp. 'Moss Beach']UJB71666.1 zinc ABC transporter substrate-binding protein [Acaryochloris sp. 'Moss Beach']
MTPNPSRLSRLQQCQLSIALLSALALGSCASSPSGETNSTQDDSKLQVTTTFLPITNFTKAVAGDRAQVTQLLPNNIGPHDYQAKPEDIQKLAKADILVMNGLEMEAFLEDMVKNAGNSELAMVDSSEGVAVIPNEEEHGDEHKGEKEGDDHDHEDHEDEDHEGEEHAEGDDHGDEDHAEDEDHDEKKDHAEGGHDHGENNPHIWLDPKRAIQQVENIRDGLIKADPDGKSTYEANAAAYIDQLKQLDTEFTEQLKPYAGKTFVTYHDFADYFARSYDLKVEYLVGIPDENASPEDVKRVINAAKSSNLKTLLSEPQASSNPFTALAQDLKVQVGTFDPLETGGTDALEADYYLSAMRANLKSLTTAFGSQPQTWMPAQPKQRTVATLPQWVQVKF